MKEFVSVFLYMSVIVILLSYKNQYSRNSVKLYRDYNINNVRDEFPQPTINLIEIVICIPNLGNKS